MRHVIYADSSALVKLVVREAESAALRRYLRRRTVLSSALARTEVTRAVLDLGDTAVAAARGLLGAVELVRVTDEVLDGAGVLRPAGVRSLDAIHLATAKLLQGDLGEVVTYDTRMADAARSLGLPVMSPS